MDNIQDQQLFVEVRKIMNGNFTDYEVFYNLSVNYIYKIINDITKDNSVTEGLVRETYNKIYQYISRLPREDAFYVWAGRIATNDTFNFLQNNNPELLYDSYEMSYEDFSFEYSHEDNEMLIPERILNNETSCQKIISVMAGLPPVYKITAQYFYYEALSISDIAKTMGCSQEVVKKRISYIKNSLKSVVGSDGESYGARLQSLSAYPVLWLLFRNSVNALSPAAVGAGSVAVSGAAVGGTQLGGIGAASVADSAAIGAAGTGASAVGSATAGGMGAVTATGSSIAAKVIAAVIGTSVLIGGTAAGIHAYKEKINAPVTEASTEATTELMEVTTEEITTEETVTDEVVDVETILREYLLSTLIPNSGVCQEGVQKEVDNDETGEQTGQIVFGGIETAYIDDLDGDGQVELLVIQQIEETDLKDSSEMSGYVHKLSIYEYVDRQIVERVSQELQYYLGVGKNDSTYYANPGWKRFWFSKNGREASVFDVAITTNEDKKYILLNMEDTYIDGGYSNYLMMSYDGTQIVNNVEVGFVWTWEKMQVYKLYFDRDADMFVQDGDYAACNNLWRETAAEYGVSIQGEMIPMVNGSDRECEIVGANSQLIYTFFFDLIWDYGATSDNSVLITDYSGFRQW